MQSFFGTREEYHKIRGDKKVFGREDCPFCPPKISSDRILWQGKHWMIIHNRFPYSGNDQHLMAIPKEHITVSTEISKEMFAELTDVYAFMQDFFGEEHYFSCTRESMAKRSVEHLHMHFIPGVLKGKFLRKMLELQGFPITQNLTL